MWFLLLYSWEYFPGSIGKEALYSKSLFFLHHRDASSKPADLLPHREMMINSEMEIMEINDGEWR